MAASVDTLSYANNFLNVDVGYFIVIFGIIGNLINLLVFTQLKLFRTNQSVFYLITLSILEFAVLIFGTSTRVISASFGYDPTRLSLFWCKFRSYVVQFLTAMIPTVICLSSLDQYSSTSHHNYLRTISTFKLAQRLVGTLVLVNSLYCIVFPIYFEIVLPTGCAATNASFNYFYSFVYLCILFGVVPIIISILFSSLAYRNVRRIVRRQIPIVRRRLEQQLTAMVLVRVALFVIATLPYSTIRSYQLNYSVDASDSHAIAVDQLLRTVAVTLYNINFAVEDHQFYFLA